MRKFGSLASSVYKRYITFPIKVAAANLRDIGHLRNDGVHQIPPAKLRFRVHGALDRESFLAVGHRLAHDLRRLLGSVGRDIFSFEHILDFGCGCGRVLRNLLDAPASCHLYGTDIDPHLIQWSEQNLPEVHWSTNGYHPPLQYADGMFDLIWAISVFTHLDEDFQWEWLAELNRIARPGAILILSVHGLREKHLSAGQQDELRSTGILHVRTSSGRLKLDGFPDFYQKTSHTRSYIEREWSRLFDIVSYVERGINERQDAVILRKPGGSPE